MQGQPYANPYGQPGYPPQGPYMGAPAELQTLKDWLRYSRIVALIVLIIGILVTLAGLAGLATALAFSAFYGAVLVGAYVVYIIYGILILVVEFLIWTNIKSLETMVEQGQYEAAKKKTLLWMILGFLFGFLTGLFLLIAYLKYDPVINWQRQSQMGGGAPPQGAVYAAYGQPAYGAPATPAYPPPPASPAPSTPPQPQPSSTAPPTTPAQDTAAAASAPATTAPTGAPPASPSPTQPGLVVNCRTCGRPTTYIPQYSRYYCYSCAQYV